MTLSWRSYLILSFMALLGISLCFADKPSPKTPTALIIPALAGTYFVYKDLHEQIHETPYAFAKIEEKSGNKLQVRLSKLSFSKQEAAEEKAQKAISESDAFFGEVFDLTTEELKELNVQKVITSPAMSSQNSSQAQHNG